MKKLFIEPSTDIGNAHRLITIYGKDIRYCHKWKKWLVWDGKRWVVDETGEIERRAKATALSMQLEAKHIDDEDKQKKFKSFALRSQDASRIRSMIALAQSEKGIPVVPEDLDNNPWILNCANGAVDLRTGLLHPHKREDLLTKMSPVQYDPDTKCPIFDQFLNRIMNGNASMVSYLQRCIGYAATGSTKEQCWFVLHGSGANGKTTLLETIRYVLGDYAGMLPVESLMVSNGDKIPNDIAQLQGLRFVTSSEVEQGRKLAEGRLKFLTGEQKIQARFLYGEHFGFQPTSKFFLDCNHPPVIHGTDEGTWRRVKVIPFEVSIPENEKDRDLQEKLKAEAPGILALIVRGSVAWYERGLGECPAVTDATQIYRDDMDTMAQFIREECVMETGAKETTGQLYMTYGSWCEHGKEKPLTKNEFVKRLRRMGLTPAKVGPARERGWEGIRLRQIELSQAA